MQRLNWHVNTKQYSVWKQGVKNAALSAIRPWREARLIRGHFYNGTSEQVTLGGRQHDVRLTSDLRFSMTVHPPLFLGCLQGKQSTTRWGKNGKGTVTEGSYYNIDNLENNNEHVKQLLIWLDAIYLTKVIKLRDVLLQYHVTRLSTKLVDICNYQITLSSTDSRQNKTARLTVSVETYITEHRVQ